MPSTHAMSGLSIPFALLLDSLRHLPEGQSATPLVVAAVAWFSTCTLSRLYMGVHRCEREGERRRRGGGGEGRGSSTSFHPRLLSRGSPADVIVGIVLGLILLALHHFLIADLVDSVVLHASPWAAVGMVLFVIALSALYPRPKKWVNSPGDTVLMISSVLGTSLAAHVLREEHIAVMSTPLTMPTIYSVLHSFPRLLIGFGLALTTRAIVKFLFVKLLVLILGHKYVSVSGLSPAERRRLADKSHASGQGVPEKKASDDGDEEDVPEDTPIEQAWAAEKKAFFERAEAQWLASKTKKTDDDDHGNNDGPKASTTGSSTTSTAAPAPMTKSPSEESLGSPVEATSPIPDMMRIEPSKRYEIELPTKIAVYTAVGFVTVCIVPSVFKLLNL